MKKPNNYAETPAGGDFTPIELGGHHLVIKQVIEQKSQSGKNMLVIRFDFDKNDRQPGYFMELFKNDIRPDKKWPNQATQYVLCEDENGNCSKQLKTFCTCVEHSNKGYNCWNSDDTFNFDGIKNKKIGGVFGEQLDFYEGKEKTKRVLRWFVSSDKVDSAVIPQISETKAYKNKGYNDDFVSVPQGIDEELPFN